MRNAKPKRIGGLFGYNASPWSTEQAMAIVCLRDFDGMTFREIGTLVGFSGQGVAKQYARWRKWAKRQPEYGPDYSRKYRKKMKLRLTKA